LLEEAHEQKSKSTKIAIMLKRQIFFFIYSKDIKFILIGQDRRKKYLWKVTIKILEKSKYGHLLNFTKIMFLDNICKQYPALHL
jgi:hypothetical protein